MMEDKKKWVPWVAVISYGIGQYVSTELSIGVIAICTIGLLLFFIRHVNDDMPFVAVWVFGLLTIAGIGAITAVVMNLGSDMLVNAISVPLFIYFVGLGVFSFKDSKSVSYKAWAGAFCIIVLLIINYSL